MSEYRHNSNSGRYTGGPLPIPDVLFEGGGHSILFWIIVIGMGILAGIALWGCLIVFLVLSGAQ